MANTEKKYFEKRERILNAINFKPTDRLPYTGSTCTIASLEKAAGRNDYLTNPNEVYADAHRAFDVDMVLQFVLPDRQDRETGPYAELDVTNTGLWSAVFGMEGAWKKEHGEFTSPEDVRDFCLSLPDASQAKDYFDDDRIYQEWIKLDKWGDFLKPSVWVPCAEAGVSWMWYGGMGYENYLMAHLLYPQELERLFAFIGEEKFLRNGAIVRAIRENDMLPLMYIGTDICGNDGPLASPEVLHDIYFPHAKRAITPMVEAGIHLMWHSDGDIMPIVPDILDSGVDGFQGFEEDKGMDLYALAETPCKNGKLPFLLGSNNVTQTIYTTPEEIRKDVKRMVDLSDKRGGGVILSPSSSIMANTPTENVLALYDAYAHQDTL